MTEYVKFWIARDLAQFLVFAGLIVVAVVLVVINEWWGDR